ncbi:MAG: superoxide dismutase Fe-Mn [Bacteroidetes bacterium]|nr:MAG: superoxide dismutase Fe-Mn [Bacteroidota bacterium]
MKKQLFLVMFLAGLLSLPFGLAAQQAVKSKTKTDAKPVPAVLGTASEVSAVAGFAGKGEDWLIPSSNLIFPDLPYAYDALEPVIDKQTVEIHYDKHHRGYFNNFKKAIAGTDLETKSVYSIFADIDKVSAAVRNNAGGFYNHVLYWSNLSPDGGGMPSGELLEAITRSFGSYEAFVQKFNEAAKTRFGSGWAWLSVDPASKELFISSTANQDNPLMSSEEKQGFPLLGMDVWEHAYYLKYQNKRADYVESFWNKVNWQDVQSRYAEYFKIAARIK